MRVPGRQSGSSSCALVLGCDFHILALLLACPSQASVSSSVNGAHFRAPEKWCKELMTKARAPALGRAPHTSPI